MLVGYARVSTQDQNLDLQKDALTKDGCQEIFTDVASGAQAEREGLANAIRFLREGDSLVVWKLDRLGRSLKDLIDNVNTLQKRGVGFRSLRENIDTTTSGGKLIFHVFGALAEFECDLIRERTQAGLAAARVRGRRGGRPKVLDEKMLALAVSLYRDRHNSPHDICTALHISKATLYRHLPSKRAVGAASSEPTDAIPQVDNGPSASPSSTL